jgi:hypothetical protein
MVHEALRKIPTKSIRCAFCSSTVDAAELADVFLS